MDMNKWYELKIDPRDVLFFRDAKPMEASSIGNGARWPVPQVFHNAMLTALHQTERRECERHRHVATGSDKNKNSSFRFGGLKTVGLFPIRDEHIHFPTPADLQCRDDSGTITMLQPVDKGLCDLPAPLSSVLVKPGCATKKTLAPWISGDDLVRYLQGIAEGITPVENTGLFTTESHPGIGIDAETGSVAKGAFYIAEYLRLEKNVSLVGFAQCRQKRYADGTDEDLLEPFFKGEHSIPFVLGGQRGVAFLQNVRESNYRRLRQNRPSGTRIKWVMLTPSIFRGGWLPSWIDAATGELWQYEKSPRRQGENRRDWRARLKREETRKTRIGRLVAACVPKPCAYSGWRAHGGRSNEHGAFATRLCVPAGAVYYFEADEPETLVDYLHGRTRSDELAEKGFGFGVCGTWNETKEIL
jgi:CRISPR type III-B/RAMP module-associated protein Cmr3